MCIRDSPSAGPARCPRDPSASPGEQRGQIALNFSLTQRINTRRQGYCAAMATTISGSVPNPVSDPAVIRRLLTTPATWAVVGLSTNVTRTAYGVARWMHACLLYTSDAADDLTRVDLGGRR